MDFKKYQPRDNNGKYRTYNIIVKIIKGIFTLWKKEK